jgi:predicted DNA-binding protein
MAVSETFQIRLNPEQLERLRQVSEARGVTVSDVLKDAIAEQWFKLNLDSKVQVIKSDDSKQP